MALVEYDDEVVALLVVDVRLLGEEVVLGGFEGDFLRYQGIFADVDGLVKVEGNLLRFVVVFR